MKKLIILISFLIVAKFSFGQDWPITQNIGSTNTKVQVPGNGGFLASLINRNYLDTTAANLTPIRLYPGGQIFTTSDSSFWLRRYNQWVKQYAIVPSGGGGTPSDTVIWRVSGNGQTILNSLSGGGIGSANNVPVWLITNGNIRIQLPASGMNLSNDTTSNKVMTFNPSTKDWGYANWVGGGGGGGNGIYGGSGSLPGNVAVTRGANSLTFNGSGSQDITFLGTGDSYISVGDAARHGIMQISQLSRGASFQLIGEGGSATTIHNEISSTMDTASASSSIDLYVSKPSVFQSKISLNDTGINMQTNSTNRMKITTGGNIGIGTSSPSFKLEISGTSSATDRKIGINGTQMNYLPDQSSSAFLNSIAFGNGLQNLTHSSGFEAWNNTAVGISALSANTTGFNNTATGVIALQNNTTGTLNSAFGAGALAANTTGTENAAFGQAALTSNVGGQFNSAFGANALLNNTSGQTNTAVGGDAMLSNSTGLQNTVGGYRGMQNNNGNFNSGWGYRWGESMNTANGNSGIGNTALGLTTTGSFNYAGGFFAGYRNTTGSYNTYLGSNAGESINQVSNLQSSVAIGAGSYTTASYQLSLSDSINRFTAVGLSKGVANYVLTDSLGNGQYWVARPNAALSLGLQDVITNDPVLTAANTIDAGGNDFTFENSNQLIFAANKTSVTNNYVLLQARANTIRDSRIQIWGDSLVFMPSLGNYTIDTLNSSANAADSMMVWNKSNGSVGIRAIPSSSSGLTVGTTTVTSGTSRAILYSNTGVLKDSSIFVFNTGGELQVGSATDAGNFRLQVTGKSNFSDTLFTTHGRFAGMDVGVYGGGMGFQNDAALTGKSGLYFRTFSGGSTNGPIVFESGSFKAQMIVSDATQNQMQVVYGGNTGYFNVGSHTNIYSSSGQELRLGSGGNLNKLTINTTGYVGANVTSPTSALHTTSFATGYASKSADYTLTASDHTIEVTATGTTQTLPTAASITGRIYTIKLTASGTGTVATTSSQTIDGSTTYSLSAQYKYVTVQSNGSNWIIIANN